MDASLGRISRPGSGCGSIRGGGLVRVDLKLGNILLVLPSTGPGVSTGGAVLPLSEKGFCPQLGLMLSRVSSSRRNFSKK